MKVLLIMLLISLSLVAQEETCYSVEIYKDSYTKRHLSEVASQVFEPSCRSMKLKSKLAVRCGCFKTKEQLKPHLKRLKRHYKNAKKTVTYARRFKEKSKKIIPKVKKVVNNKKCYSIEILTQLNNQKSMDTLKEKQFPKTCVQIPHIKTISVDCGCYETKKEVIINYKEFQKKYDEAKIIEMKQTTYQKHLPKVKKEVVKAIEVKESEKVEFVKVEMLETQKQNTIVEETTEVVEVSKNDK